MMDYVCASCGKMTDDFYKRCPRCNSARIVTVKFAEQHLGPNWSTNIGTPPRSTKALAVETKV